MRILWIGGTHPRHLYYANAVAGAHSLSGALVQTREHMLPEPPPGTSEHDRENFIRHFENRADAEERHFGSQDFPDCPQLEVAPEELNSEKSVSFVEDIDPDVVLLFGCGLIKPPLYPALPEHTINLHLGLSPRYRGTATLFWPFYFLEPNHAGSTFHYIVSEPDAGKIIHQVVPELEKGDRIHDVACKTVKASAHAAVRLLDLFDKRGAWKRFEQRTTGKNFLSRDFKPQHLRLIYDMYEDRMVERYLAGDLPSADPKLRRQYE